MTTAMSAPPAGKISNEPKASLIYQAGTKH